MIILSAAKASNSGAGSSMLFMIILLIAMIGLMVWTSRKQKKQQSQVQDFRQTLKEGDPVATVGGLLGTVHSVDLEHDEVVIDSEGSPVQVAHPGHHRAPDPSGLCFRRRGG